MFLKFITNTLCILNFEKKMSFNTLSFNEVLLPPITVPKMSIQSSSLLISRNIKIHIALLWLVWWFQRSTMRHRWLRCRMPLLQTTSSLLKTPRPRTHPKKAIMDVWLTKSSTHTCMVGLLTVANFFEAYLLLVVVNDWYSSFPNVDRRKMLAVVYH